MGRQLAFWKYEEGIYLDNQEVYRSVCGEGKTVAGLAVLPIDDYNYGGLEGAFTIYTQPQSVVFDCSLRMSEKELNKIIDLMAGFGCPYYDPQIATRFDGK